MEVDNDKEHNADEMDVDGDEHEEGSQSAKRKKAKKNKSRTELDIAALTSEQAALSALESNQLLHLRLRKRYYAEGLNFIRQIEGAMEILTQLLGSTNKAEVLESMEFFRVAFEYQFETAEVSRSLSYLQLSALL
jgi:condensin complex subunit 1